MVSLRGERTEGLKMLDIFSGRRDEANCQTSDFQGWESIRFSPDRIGDGTSELWGLSRYTQTGTGAQSTVVDVDLASS